MILKENIDVPLFILGWIGILWVFVLYVVVVQYFCGAGVVLDWYVFFFCVYWCGMFWCCLWYVVLLFWVQCVFLCGTGVVCFFSKAALEWCLRFFEVSSGTFSIARCVVCFCGVFRDILKNNNAQHTQHTQQSTQNTHDTPHHTT